MALPPTIATLLQQLNSELAALSSQPQQASGEGPQQDRVLQAQAKQLEELLQELKELEQTSTVMRNAGLAEIKRLRLKCNEPVDDIHQQLLGDSSLQLRDAMSTDEHADRSSLEGKKNKKKRISFARQDIPVSAAGAAAAGDVVGGIVNLSKRVKKQVEQDWFYSRVGAGGPYHHVPRRTLTHCFTELFDSSIACVAFSHAGDRVVVGMNKYIRVLNATSGALLASLTDVAHLNMDCLMRSVVFSPDDKYVAVGAADHSVKVWDVVTESVRVFPGHRDQVHQVLFTGDGQSIVSGSADGTVKVWEVASGNCIRTFQHQHQQQQQKPQQEQNSAAAEVGAAVSNRPITCIALSPDEKFLAIGGGKDAQIHLYDYESGQYVDGLPGHAAPITSIQYVSDKHVNNGAPRTRLLSGSRDGTLRVWHLECCVDTAKMHHDAGTVVAGEEAVNTSVPLNAHSDCIVGTCLLLGDQQQQKQQQSDQQHRQQLWCVSGSRDRSMYIWDLTNNCAHSIISSHRAGVSGVAAQRQGNKFASVGSDGALKVWEWS